MVTGASSGLAAIFAQRLGERGFNLLLTGRHPDRLEQVRQRVIADARDCISPSSPPTWPPATASWRCCVDSVTGPSICWSTTPASEPTAPSTDPTLHERWTSSALTSPHHDRFPVRPPKRQGVADGRLGQARRTRAGRRRWPVSPRPRHTGRRPRATQPGHRVPAPHPPAASSPRCRRVSPSRLPSSVLEKRAGAPEGRKIPGLQGPVNCDSDHLRRMGRTRTAAGEWHDQA